MDTKRIYDAQLNVSKFYTDETINDLVSRVSFIGERSYYNTKTNTIDINVNRIAMVEDDYTIRNIIIDWLNTLPADKKDIEVMIANNEYIFNIAKLGYPGVDKHIINIYLY